MPPICNAAALITCPHQVGIAVIVPSQVQVLVGGLPALRATDVINFKIAPPPTVPPIVDPCTSFLPPAPIPPAGMSTKVLIGGVPALLPTMIANTDGAPPDQFATVKFPGQVLVNTTM